MGDLLGGGSSIRSPNGTGQRPWTGLPAAEGHRASFPHFKRGDNARISRNMRRHGRPSNDRHEPNPSGGMLPGPAMTPQPTTGTKPHNCPRFSHAEAAVVKGLKPFSAKNPQKPRSHQSGRYLARHKSQMCTSQKRVAGTHPKRTAGRPVQERRRGDPSKRDGATAARLCRSRRHEKVQVDFLNGLPTAPMCTRFGALSLPDPGCRMGTGGRRLRPGDRLPDAVISATPAGSRRPIYRSSTTARATSILRNGALT